MASFRSVSAPVIHTSGGNEVALPVPAGTVVGDLLVGIVGFGGPHWSLSTPSGWTAEPAVVGAAGGCLSVAYKVAASDDDALYAWSWTAPNERPDGLPAPWPAATGIVVAIASPSGSAPASLTGNANSVAMGVVAAPGVSVSGSGEVVVSAWAAPAEVGNGFTIPSALTELCNVAGADRNVLCLSLAAGYTVSTGSGTTEAQEAVARDRVNGLVGATVVVA